MEELRWARHIARTEEGRSALKILTGIPTGKKKFQKGLYRDVSTILE